MNQSRDAVGDVLKKQLSYRININVPLKPCDPAKTFYIGLLYDRPGMEDTR